MLLGRKLFFSEELPVLGDAGDLICVNGSQYLEGIYRPLRSQESIHVRFVQHERALKWFLRNDGRPWWNSVFTPRNGSTESPWVQLAARA